MQQHQLQHGRHACTPFTAQCVGTTVRAANTAGRLPYVLLRRTSAPESPHPRPRGTLTLPQPRQILHTHAAPLHVNEIGA